MLGIFLARICKFMRFRIRTGQKHADPDPKHCFMLRYINFSSTYLSNFMLLTWRLCPGTQDCCFQSGSLQRRPSQNIKKIQASKNPQMNWRKIRKGAQTTLYVEKQWICRGINRHSFLVRLEMQVHRLSFLNKILSLST